MDDIGQKVANNDTNNNAAYEMVYPEIYYRVLPFVAGVCDQVIAYGGAMPSSEVIERIADSIYTDVTTMYPDLVDYVGDSDAVAQPVFANISSRRFRRRGLFRDFIQILLLNELFRRI